MTDRARKRRPALQRWLAELVGTFALVFVGCGAIMVDAETDAPGHLGVSLAFGLVIAVMLVAVGPVSQVAGVYLTAPFVGGILGAVLVVALYRSARAE